MDALADLHEAQGFARNAEPGLHLRVYVHELNEPAQRIANEMIELVSAVVANLVAQHTRGDSDSDGVFL